MALFLHCKNNGIGTLPRTRKPTDTASMTVTLPVEILEVLEELIEERTYGTSRAQVGAQLILDHVKLLRVQGIVPPPKRRRG